MDDFPCLRLAYEAIEKSGNMPCILNAANEVCNAAFREGKISFYEISDIIEHCMHNVAFINAPTLEQLYTTDAATRTMAMEQVQKS
jgi:1-deoxy-D-xylulose-5-phosphate reductoisomerase